jgi:hypothetical protein
MCSALCAIGDHCSTSAIEKNWALLALQLEEVQVMLGVGPAGDDGLGST